MPDMAEHLRMFVALQTSDQLLDLLAQIQRQLQARLPTGSVRWTRRDQLHLTLRFLGDVPAGQVEALAAALREAGAGCPPLRLGLEGAGCFPNARNPRVLWIGVNGDLPQLEELQQRVEIAMTGFGDHREERAFHPHLTLGRVAARDFQAARAVGEAVGALEVGSLGQWTADRLHLVRSQLAASGPTYTDVAIVELRGGMD
jgi:2'-5' RNA ligase